MVSSRQSVFSGMCVISFCLHIFLCVTSATDVVRFEQSGRPDNNNDNNNDNIYDLLEDEQFVMVDTKSATRHRPAATRTGNASLPFPKHPPSYLPPHKDSASSHVAAASAAAAAAAGPQPKSGSPPGLPQAGYTSRASAVAVEDLGEELEEDVLIISQDRESVEEGEERRRREEQELARRVRRQAPMEGSGLTTVDVEVTTNIPWNANFLSDTSQEYINLVNVAKSAIQAVLNSLGNAVTVSVNGFRESQGSTVILLSVDFGDNGADRVALAQQMLVFQRLGLTYGGTSYDVTAEPQIENDSGQFQASTCYLCRGYQTCVPRDGGQNYVCRISSQDFFPFGHNQGDGTLPRGRKKYSRVLNVEGGIPVASQIQTKVAVSMNGLISFGKKYNSFSPKRLPRGKRLLMSGYWADFLLADDDPKSNVWYQVYEKTDSVTYLTAAMFAMGKSQVELYSGQTDYDPTFMLVATFEEMPADHSDSSTTERVNFQMVVISDGFTTYGMIIFASGGMQWDPNANRRIVIGYLEENFDIDLTRPDQVIGTTERRGVFFFELGSVDVNSARSCLNWYYRELPWRNFYQWRERFLPRCPCSFRAILFSFAYFPYSLQNGVFCFLLNPFFGQFGKTCCYRAPGVFARNRPDAGTFLRHNPLRNPAEYTRLDEEPKRLCCEESNLCSRYYRVRPPGTCRRFWIFVIAIGRGDPHVTTLDGKSFAFNAIGEFTLFKVDQHNMTFELQGRTCQAKSKTGELVAASVFCALVAKGNNSETLQVQLSISGDFLVVFVNTQDVTLSYNNESNFRTQVGDLVVRRSNDTLRATFGSVINLNVTVAYNLLTYELMVGSEVIGPVGLMGNMDGNPDNDYILPNGTTLPNDTSERDLLAYGKAWAIDDSSTIFQYEAGQNTAFFTNDSFVPIFLSEVNQTVREEAESVCGGAADIGCVFDYIATQDADLAVGTKMVKEQVDAELTSSENAIPEVTGPTRIEVVLNEPITFSLNATDVEDSQVPTYNIVNQPSSNFAFDNATQEAVWTPTTNETTSLEFTVEDSTGATSPSLKIEIVMCSGCNNRGTCNYNTTREQSTTDEYFQMATCDCQPYYSGDDCEENFDACADDPCPLLTTCTDLTPDEHEQEGSNSAGYNCSDCPQGYIVDITDGVPVCYDVNECQTTPCDGVATCTNTQGSFFCTCNSGYRLDTIDNTVCNDINECIESTDNCEQLCENREGDFTCACLPGYTLNATTSTTCYNEEDPCADLQANCSYACTNESGSAQCLCSSGYILADDQTNCTDVNECDQNICSQKCDNFGGGFTCSCFAGFQLDDDKITCNECPPTTYGDNCNLTCECHGRGTCDRVRGCNCTGGWTGVTCTVDVDECVTLTSPCPDTKVCFNTNGSYVCRCPTGYTKGSDGLCSDIDECSSAALNDCDQICSNTLGSYVCSCTTGYVYNAANRSCVDVNECAEAISECEQLCDNYPGSANCYCHEGFIINDDRKTCSKERDPCEVLADAKNCTYGCRVVSSAAQCYCPTGFQLAVDQTTCVDIDECRTNSTNNCNQQCDNTPGSYQCSCNNGFSLDNDQRTCTECDEYHWGPDCATDCNCSPLNTVRCDPTTGCVCKPGWLGTLCAQNRDECQSSPCPASSLCVDVPGSYRCVCEVGYSRDNDSAPCTDVNECDNNPCDQTCSNTEGSYTCSCTSGFVSVGDNCNDINECLSNPCDQICRNTVGGFACECYPGYLLNTTTRNTCYGQTTCLSNTTCTQGCRIVNATETCYCRPGFEQNSTDPNVCDDIDECATTPCTNGICNNFDGGFNCSCSNGTYLLGDDVTCEVCPQGQFGKDCASNCTCNPATTQACDVISGSCTCNSGWEGEDCSQDIDECTVNSTICSGVNNSQCVNSNGAFVCQCDVGFSASDGSCLPCDDAHYGRECSSLCSCERANTRDCDDVNGTCTCNAYWKGANCSTDIDECSDNLANCQTNVFEACRNLDGGFACDCVTGYERPSPGDNCMDTNECLYEHLNTCDRVNETCINTNGSFQCVCASGFNGTAGACTDVNECDDPDLDTCNERQDCLNTVGSFTCPCKPTYTLINSVCTDINECSQDALNNCTAREDCVNTVGGYTCECKSRYVRNAAGKCIPNYRNIKSVLTLAYTPSQSLANNASVFYQDLLELVQTALNTTISNNVGNPFHALVVTGLREGSVLVTSELQIDASKTDNPEGLAARAFEDLLTVGVLNVNGTDRPVTDITINDTSLSDPNSLCEVFYAITTCTDANEECQVNSESGIPSCGPVSKDDDDAELIIGLGVGIPLFFIVVIVIAAIIYMCVRRRKESAASDQAEASEHGFPSIFAGQLATKGSWGAAQRYHMYSPDNVSVSHTSDSSGEGQLLKGRRQGRSDFQDSAWYDNRVAHISSPRREDGAGTEAATEAATSNFSWEYMFRLLAPYRDGFEIQRPNVHSSPNPAYSPQSRGPKPDSVA